ncbi:hypothetical protein ACSAZL_05575 [Methanosarcina sp. T3]|uniref:hypothetical protein n=1 Tax=Methanosarcina sp. T3 TaxID=3439062 RepID=UPI003F877B02
MNPLGNEMVPMPKYNLMYNVNARVPHTQASEQFNYESKMYAYYDTSSNANVTFSSTWMHAMNGMIYRLCGEKGESCQPVHDLAARGCKVVQEYYKSM